MVGTICIGTGKGYDSGGLEAVIPIIEKFGAPALASQLFPSMESAGPLRFIAR